MFILVLFVSRIFSTSCLVKYKYSHENLNYLVPTHLKKKGRNFTNISNILRIFNHFFFYYRVQSHIIAHQPLVCNIINSCKIINNNMSSRSFRHVHIFPFFVHTHTSIYPGILSLIKYSKGIYEHMVIFKQTCYYYLPLY